MITPQDVFKFYSSLQNLDIDVRKLDLLSQNRFQFLKANYPSIKLCTYYDIVKNELSLDDTVFKDTFGIFYVVPVCSYAGNLLAVIFRSVLKSDRFHYVYGNRGLLEFSMASFFFDPRWGDKLHSDPIILVEGMFDLLPIASIYPYTVAVLGGGHTYDRLRILPYMTDKVYIMFDNDAAGRGHTESTVKILDNLKVNNTVITNWSESDPGDYMDKGKVIDLRILLTQFNLIR